MSEYLSIRKFATLAGVSPATVSQVYANPSCVSARTVQRVRELAAEVGYIPGIVSGSANGGATRSIGVLISSPFPELARSVQNRLLAADYLPIILSIATAADDAVTRLLRHKVDGIILGMADERLDFPEICTRMMMRLPTVLMGPPRSGLSADAVQDNNYEGGAMAARHLLELGHRRFGALKFGEDIVSDCLDRMRGFRETVTAAGGILDARFVIGGYKPGDNEVSLGARIVRQLVPLLREPDAPTAFFCTTDFLALDFLEAVKAAGKRVPEDFSIVGFGNLMFGAYLPNPLTTVRQFPEQFGIAAADLILQRLREPSAPLQTVTIPVELIVRETTRNIRMKERK